jgi:hypothetical protein
LAVAGLLVSRSLPLAALLESTWLLRTSPLLSVSLPVSAVGLCPSRSY